MAIFYYDVNILNKADHSVVATAAYDSNESLYSERDDEIKNIVLVILHLNLISLLLLMLLNGLRIVRSYGMK